MLNNCNLLFINNRENKKYWGVILSQFNKKIGSGSISLLICIIGIVFAFSFGDKGSLGDVILRFLGLKAWSNGNRGVHYTIYYTLVFFIPSVSNLKMI